jgi:hypothetical protein
MLDRAIRDLDRERMGLQQQEKKLIVEIKKMAKDGQMVRATQKPHLERLAATGVSAQPATDPRHPVT